LVTDERRWRAVDGYFARVIVGADRTLEQALESNAAAGLPQIDVSPTHGKLRYLLMRMAGARKALEIGALGGYPAIWIARALPPDGRLVTLEADERHAKVAAQNIARAA
jgi:predicted O-methyltransferase YrrM